MISVLFSQVAFNTNNLESETATPCKETMLKQFEMKPKQSSTSNQRQRDIKDNFLYMLIDAVNISLLYVAPALLHLIFESTSKPACGGWKKRSFTDL